MQSQRRSYWSSIKALVMLALVMASSGCCCVQGVPSNGACGMGACAGGGCGETYVDEWVSTPPSVDHCCQGNCRPVRSLLQTLWGNRFVQGCDTCSSGCDDGCAGGCGYASAGGSGCTSCGGGGMSGGGCTSCAGGATVTEPMMPTEAQPMPTSHGHAAYNDSESRMVPGSFKISPPRRVNATVASERINPARQKMDAKRASYSN